MSFVYANGGLFAPFVTSGSGLATEFWSYLAGNIDGVEDKKQAVKMMISFDR